MKQTRAVAPPTQTQLSSFSTRQERLRAGYPPELRTALFHAAARALPECDGPKRNPHFVKQFEDGFTFVSSRIVDHVGAILLEERTQPALESRRR